MDSTIILKKKVLDGKPHGRRRVGRPRLRWKDIRRHFLVTADYENVRTLARDGGVCWRTTEEQGSMRAVAPLKNEEEREKKKKKRKKMEKLIF
jgi:hypothetical protein